MTQDSYRRTALLLALIFIMAVNSKASDENTQEQPPVFAFVALKKEHEPDEKTLRKELATVLPKLEIKEVKIDGDSCVINVDDSVVMVALMRAPIPWKDLQGPCQQSLLWPEAEKQMKSHRVHLLVALISEEGTLVERNILLTKVMAAMTRIYPAVGVYWGHGEVVVEPKSFYTQAKEATAKSPPVLLWVGLFPQKNRDGSISLITQGLDYFQKMDIEVNASRKPLRELLTLVSGTAYIMLVGEVIADGDTVGSEGEPNQRIPTRHAKSMIDRPEKVLLIDY